jgi:oxalate decarboxylase/phosphoglucose isomerase-like protein (cupin superfamily)
MAFRRLGVVISKTRSKSYYQRWMEHEGIPIIEGFAVRDPRAATLSPWKRLGCEGAYLHFRDLEGLTGVYVGKLAPGRSSEPEKHLYEKIIYIVEGEGVAEVQQQGRVPQAFRWQAGSLFSPPMNTTHRLINHGHQPAVFVAVTTAPMALDHYRNARFVFNSDFCFSDRYDGERDYFAPREQRYLSSRDRQWICETNFIFDARSAAGITEQKKAGVSITQIEIANNSLAGYLAAWPIGKCYDGQELGGAAVLVNVGSEGYSLMWPNELGPKPYESGRGDRVVRVDWQPGSVFSVPAHYFQRHFNTGREPALQLAIACGSEKFPLGLVHAAAGSNSTQVEAAEEDRVIERIYEAELRRRGILAESHYAVAANGDCGHANLNYPHPKEKTGRV